MGKWYYSWSISKDPAMKGTTVRCTTIPEELGRISYLLSDKTGTLTQNSMVLKKLHLGFTCYTQDGFSDVIINLNYYYYYLSLIHNFIVVCGIKTGFLIKRFGIKT